MFNIITSTYKSKEYAKASLKTADEKRKYNIAMKKFNEIEPTISSDLEIKILYTETPFSSIIQEIKIKTKDTYFHIDFTEKGACCLFLNGNKETINKSKINTNGLNNIKEIDLHDIPKNGPIKMALDKFIEEIKVIPNTIGIVSKKINNINHIDEIIIINENPNDINEELYIDRITGYGILSIKGQSKVLELPEFKREPLIDEILDDMHKHKISSDEAR